MESLKDSFGVFILAGCAAEKVSYEANAYAQGVLTYSLLLGMHGPALKNGQIVDIVSLFNFAASNVSPRAIMEIKVMCATPNGSRSPCSAKFAITVHRTSDSQKLRCVPGRRIEARCRFVKKHELRARHQCAGQSKAFLHAA